MSRLVGRSLKGLGTGPGIGRGIALLALATLTTLPSAAQAQGPAAPEPMSSRAPAPVPTTKVLAIGSFTATATPAEWQKVLPDEVRATVRLYLDGKIDQWFVKQDQSGVVFLMNVTDSGEAKALLEKLPFGPAGLMKFQLIPLGPISPLRMLLADPAKDPAK